MPRRRDEKRTRLAIAMRRRMDLCRSQRHCGAPPRASRSGLPVPTSPRLNAKYGIQLLPDRAPANHSRPYRWHIDFLQVRNGAVHILDYKPDARTNRPFAQLTIYAVALTSAGSLPPRGPW